MLPNLIFPVNSQTFLGLRRFTRVFKFPGKCPMPRTVHLLSENSAGWLYAGTRTHWKSLQGTTMPSYNRRRQPLKFWTLSPPKSHPLAGDSGAARVCTEFTRGSRADLSVRELWRRVDRTRRRPSRRRTVRGTPTEDRARRPVRACAPCRRQARPSPAERTDFLHAQHTQFRNFIISQIH